MPTATAAQVANQVSASAGNAPGHQRGPVACAAAVGFRRVRATAARGALRFSIARARRAPFSVSVFEAAHGRRVVDNRRVFHARSLRGSFGWRPSARLPDGAYFARVGMSLPGGRHDIRRVTLRLSHGRFHVVASHYRRDTCGTISSFKLSSPAFGGTTRAALGVAYRLGVDADAVRVELLRGTRVVRHLAQAGHQRARTTYRLRIAPAGLARGTYRVRLTVHAGRRVVRSLLTSRRL